MHARPSATRRSTTAASLDLALDGTGAGRSQEKGCDVCRPVRNQKREILGYHHKLVMISVVGTGLTLPLDVEPYGPGDSEYNAGRRLLRRAVRNLGRRFADYVVADGDYATAPFLHDVGDLGLSRRRPPQEQSPRIVHSRPETVSLPASPSSLSLGQGPGGNLGR